ncbi:hypothetical protein GN956_G9975 [Arapaima gigas]
MSFIDPDSPAASSCRLPAACPLQLHSESKVKPGQSRFGAAGLDVSRFEMNCETRVDKSQQAAVAHFSSHVRQTSVWRKSKLRMGTVLLWV